MSESAIDRALHLAPFWVLALAVFAGIAAAAWLGWWLRKRHDRKQSPSAQKDNDHEGLVVSSVMGLLALLIGFTFSLAIDHFDTWRERVLLEANAIGTTYLRTQLLEEPHRSRITHMLLDFTDLSIALSQARPGPDQNALLKKNDALVTDLWAATGAAFPTVKPYDFSTSYLEAMNSLIDLNAARQQARHARVASEILLALYVNQVIAAGVIGYAALPVRRVLRHRDRCGFPVGGGIKTSQEPMLLLKASLATTPPEVFDRYIPARP